MKTYKSFEEWYKSEDFWDTCRANELQKMEMAWDACAASMKEEVDALKAENEMCHEIISDFMTLDALSKKLAEKTEEALGFFSDEDGNRMPDGDELEAALDAYNNFKPKITK